MSLPLPFPDQTRESPGVLLVYLVDPKPLRRILPPYLEPEEPYGDGALVLLQASVTEPGERRAARYELTATAAVRRRGEAGTAVLGRWTASRREAVWSRLAGLPAAQAAFAVADTEERFTLTARLRNGRSVADLVLAKRPPAGRGAKVVGLLPSERASTLFSRVPGLPPLLLTFTTELTMLSRDLLEPERVELWELVRLGVMTAEQQGRPALALYCNPLIVSVGSARLGLAPG